MTDAFETLRHDHDEVRRMFTELENGPTRSSGATDEQLQERKRLVERLIIEESKHEAVEEEFFWPVVRQMHGGVELADRAVSQESAGKQLLASLDRLHADADEFERMLGRFIDDGREHIEFEETRVWPKLKRELTTEQGSRLGAQLEQGKRRAPTRPHPNTPPTSGVLRAAGPAVAAADRLRDAVTGRGKAIR